MHRKKENTLLQLRFFPGDPSRRPEGTAFPRARRLSAHACAIALRCV